MKYILLLLLTLTTLTYAKDGFPDNTMIEEFKPERTLSVNSKVDISVIGQGVAPSFARTPAQSYALAKRAAVADAYRILAERIKGVKVQGKDTIKNMSIKSSVVNTKVEAMIKNAKVVETKFKDGLCEVEMEISLDYNNF